MASHWIQERPKRDDSPERPHRLWVFRTDCDAAYSFLECGQSIRAATVESKVSLSQDECESRTQSAHAIFANHAGNPSNVR